MGEPGIQGVVVNLLDAELSLLAMTTTDADGYYLFDGLDADTYVVGIAASNFASGGVLEGWYATLPNRGGSEALDSDGDLAAHRSAPVTLAAGEHNPDVDFGFFVTGIDLVKTGPGSVSVGDTITYHFQVVNTGDVDLNAIITDTLPISVTLGGTLIPPGGTLIPPGGTVILPDGRVAVTWTAVITAPGSVWMGTILVTADEGPEAPLVNSVEVTTKEGATGKAVVIVNAYKIYLPLVIRND